MKTLALSLLLFIAFVMMPRTQLEAASVCGASPSATGNLYPTGLLLSVPSATYITAVCASVNGVTYTITQGAQIIALDPAGCFMAYKTPHYAFIMGGPHWSKSCPNITLTLRVVKSFGSAG